MNIQQISKDRLRVMLNLKDLDKYDLDYASISKESPGTKRLLKEILTQAQKSGFSANRCKILLEVLPGKDSGCILYLTKSACSKKDKDSQKAKDDVPQNGYFLKCENLDDAISAIGHFADFPDIPLQRSTLYYLENEYHLLFLPVNFGLDRDRLVSLLAALSEYGDAESYSPVREALLEEHGKIIVKKRAVENFIRYFC